MIDGPASAVDVLRDGVAFARGRGLAGAARLLSVSLGASLVHVGNLDEAEAMTSATLHELEAAGDVAVVPDTEIVLAQIAALRGDTRAALEWVKRLSSADVLSRRWRWAPMARILADAGDDEAARQLLGDIVDPTRSQAGSGEDLRDAVPAAVAIGDLEVAERLLDRASRPGHLEHQSVSGRSRVAEARARYDEAAAGFAEASDRWGRRSGPCRTRPTHGSGWGDAWSLLGGSTTRLQRLNVPALCVRADGSCSRDHGG